MKLCDIDYHWTLHPLFFIESDSCLWNWHRTHNTLVLSELQHLKELPHSKGSGAGVQGSQLWQQKEITVYIIYTIFSWDRQSHTTPTLWTRSKEYCNYNVFGVNAIIEEMSALIDIFLSPFPSCNFLLQFALEDCKATGWIKLLIGPNQRAKLPICQKRQLPRQPCSCIHEGMISQLQLR